MAPVYPAVNSIMLSALPKDRHAAMTGLIMVFPALDGTLGSFMTGTDFRLFNGQTAFYLTLLPMPGIMAALFVFRRESRVAAASDWSSTDSRAND